MHFGQILRGHFGTHWVKSQPIATPSRCSPPPVKPPQFRTLVLSLAKRSTKRLKDNETSKIDDGGASSGRDAALENIPSEDEVASAPKDAFKSSASDLTAAASSERTAAQGPDISVSAPSTSYAVGATQPMSSRKPRSTVLTLAEYNLLMEAVATKEKALAVQREKTAREAAGTSALIVPEVLPIETSRQGFHAFALDGGDLELLVAETADGRLMLSDSYVAVKAGDDSGGGAAAMQYSRLKLEENIPKEPLLFQVFPWTERGSGDMFKRKAPTNKVKKVYFVGIEAADDDGVVTPLFDLDNVFVFDGSNRMFSRSEVRVVGSLPMLEPVLRIRPSGITLEESYLLPDPIEVSMSTATDLADMSEEELAERMSDLEKDAESLDELDETPDVPSVDMM